MVCSTASRVPSGPSFRRPKTARTFITATPLHADTEYIKLAQTGIGPGQIKNIGAARTFTPQKSRVSLTSIVDSLAHKLMMSSSRGASSMWLLLRRCEYQFRRSRGLMIVRLVRTRTQRRSRSGSLSAILVSCPSFTRIVPTHGNGFTSTSYPTTRT